MASAGFAEIKDKRDLEEGGVFAPRFDATGLIVCMTVEASTNEPLMLAYMNAESLRLTLETRIAHYWSRSRNALWRKGDTSGQTQRVVDIRVDCDQDAILLRVEAGGDGGACHTGRKSCFYRAVDLATGALKFIDR
ncbi:MAG: phosphoribosyl-AMP cyclohydrolase [Rhodoblastus sp.]|nr:phosphoribosyl-AMP cyclohydrolase [Rhodoblastus sp.]